MRLLIGCAIRRTPPKTPRAIRAITKKIGKTKKG